MYKIWARLVSLSTGACRQANYQDSRRLKKATLSTAEGKQTPRQKQRRGPGARGWGSDPNSLCSCPFLGPREVSSHILDRYPMTCGHIRFNVFLGQASRVGVCSWHLIAFIWASWVMQFLSKLRKFGKFRIKAVLWSTKLIVTMGVRSKAEAKGLSSENRNLEKILL